MSIVEIQPQVLFDNRGHVIENPEEMVMGDLFYLTPKEPATHYEPIRNPFPVGPTLLTVEGIESLYWDSKSSDNDVDLWLVRVIDLHEPGTCRIETKVKNAKGLIAQFEEKGEIPPSENERYIGKSEDIPIKHIDRSLNGLIHRAKL